MGVEMEDVLERLRLQDVRGVDAMLFTLLESAESGYRLSRSLR